LLQNVRHYGTVSSKWRNLKRRPVDSERWPQLLTVHAQLPETITWQCRELQHARSEQSSKRK
jgi:hypothetical protein